MIILECEQRTPEWYAARVGKPTASGFSKIVTSTGERSKSREGYLYELAGERLSGVMVESYVSSCMSWGIRTEDKAAEMLEFMEDIETSKVGMCLTDDMSAGCSPDRLVVGVEKGVEIKCPKLKTHHEYLALNRLPPEYVQQVQGSMWVTGYRQWYFVSYFPGTKPLILTIDRDENFISKLHREMLIFCSDLERLIRELSE